MNDIEAKQWLPLIQALAEGKLQTLCTDGTWNSCSHINFNVRESLYRIKPELKYRAYSDIREVPVGLIVKNKTLKHVGVITGASVSTVGTLRDQQLISLGAGTPQTLESLFECYTFLDGSPCGVES